MCPREERGRKILEFLRKKNPSSQTTGLPVAEHEGAILSSTKQTLAKKHLDHEVHNHKIPPDSCS